MLEKITKQIHIHYTKMPFFPHVVILLSIPWIIILSVIGYYFNDLVVNGNNQVVLTVMLVITGIEALVITAFFQNKTNQIEGLLRAYNKLNDIEHRKMRKGMFNAFVERTGEFKLHPEFCMLEKNLIDILDGKSSTKGIKTDGGKIVRLGTIIKQIRSDYDEIGALMKYNLIPKTAFLDVYWGNVIRSWVALYGNTKQLQEHVLTSYFMSNFEYLKNEAMIFWKKREPNRTINFYRD